MATVRQSHTGTVDQGISFGGVVWEAQTFTPTLSHDIERVDLVLYDLTAIADADVTVQIWGVDGSDKPNPSNVLGTCSPLVNTSTIQDQGDYPAEVYTTFLFPTKVSVTASTMYAIVVKIPDETASAWIGKDSVSGYATGVPHQSSNSGADWSAQSGDYMFKEYGDADPTAFIPVDSNYTRKLIAVGGNEVWTETSSGTMAELSAANSDIDVTKILDMAELYGKAFVANDTNLKVVDLINVSIATAGMDADVVKGMILTGGSSGAKMVVDYVTALSSAAVIYGKRITTATFTTGETVTGTDVSFVMTAANEVAGPFWYDWAVFGGDTTVYGTMPTNATIVCNYRGRAVLAGDSKNPHQWYMARQGNPWNWLYGQNDAQSAVAGNDADAGEVGDIITALIPYKDDWMAIGCSGSIWYLNGDPAEGGSLNELDLTVGIFGKDAWCFDGGGNLYFWGTNGIYRTKIPAQPECISEIKLPGLVDDEAADPTTHRITMSYDRRRAGINITITKNSDGTNSNYWYDLRTGGFFPESYPEECAVHSAFHYEATDPDYKKVMIGCRDGYIRYFLDSAADDDIGGTDEAINAYVTYAPLPMSSSNKFEGKLTDFDVVPAGGGSGGSQSDSSNISYEIYAEIDAEKVLESLSAGTNPKIAGTVTAPGRRRGSLRKKIRGVYLGFKVFNSTAAEIMALEDLMYEVKQSGRLK